MLGTIKIDQKGFSAEFSNIIEEDNNAYIVEYAQHKEGITCTRQEIGKIKKVSEEEIYFCVKEDLCYPAKKITK